MRASATCVSMAISLRLSISVLAASLPPLTPKLTTPHVPFGIYFCNERIFLAAGQAGVLHPGNLLMPLQKARDGQGVFAVAPHAHVQAFQAKVEEIGAHGRGGHAQIAHELRP